MLNREREGEGGKWGIETGREAGPVSSTRTAD